MMLKINIFCLVIFTLFFNVNIAAVILNADEVEQSELTLLQDETKVFQFIGMGIALSLAECEGVDLCSLTVEENEIKELLKALESRISALILKQEDAKDSSGIDNVLTAYMNERDSYNAHLEKLRSITSTLDPDAFLKESNEIDMDFPVESARNEALFDYLTELEAFEDEELEDDEDLEDLPDLTELDDVNSIP
ncbi:hypothetical protein OAB90_00820 [bacterium]|nr:hypothetical protein [bacterium]